MLKFFYQYHYELFFVISILIIGTILYYIFKERKLMQHIASLDNIISGEKQRRDETLDDLDAVIDLSEKTADSLKEIRTTLIAKDK